MSYGGGRDTTIDGDAWAGLYDDAGDALYGGAGNDRLHGDDVLDGWSGADEMTGGAGADRFLLGSGISGGLYMNSGRDAITDFGQGDRIDLSRVMPDEAFVLIGQEAFSGTGRPEVRFSPTADGVLVQIDAPSTHSGNAPPPLGAAGRTA